MGDNEPPTLIAGNNVVVMAYWTIDVTKTIEIGDNVLFAGRYGQVYSYTFDLMNNRLDFSV